MNSLDEKKNNLIERFKKYIVSRQLIPEHVTARMSDAQFVSMRTNTVMLDEIVKLLMKQEATINRLRRKVKKINAQRHGYAC